ncbi:unnamed protein product [Phytomonas sp. Hart1]|nr:unnamed protein product [Phytomonas sp. Hart1]|eukprot:CCW66598.1 unnamed protein product [Phytomonas sp. isolate Hart1]
MLPNVVDINSYEAQIPESTRLFAEGSTPSTAKPSPDKLSYELSTPHPQTPYQLPDNLIESHCADAFLMGTNTELTLNFTDRETKDSKGLVTSLNSPTRLSSPTESFLESLAKKVSFQRVRKLFLHWRDHRYYTAVALRYIRTLRSEHAREHYFHHWYRCTTAHFRSRKELADQKRCEQVVKTKVKEFLRGLLRRWWDATLTARFAMQNTGRRVFCRWRRAVICLAHRRKYIGTHGGYSSSVGIRERGLLRNFWDLWRERFMHVYASRWHKQRQQQKVLLSLLQRAKEHRYDKSLLLYCDKLQNALVFRRWRDHFIMKTRLRTYSENYTQRRMQSTFEYWKNRYTLRGASTEQEVELQRLHKSKRLEHNFLFWRKSLWLRRRLREVSDRCLLGREELIKLTWDRWAIRTRYRLVWWQDQAEVAKRFHLYVLARHSLLHWVRRLTEHQQALKVDMDSRMEIEASNHYDFHLFANTFFKWKTKMFLITRFNVNARPKQEKPVLQQPAVIKNMSTNSRKGAFVQPEKDKIPKTSNIPTPSTRSVDSPPPKSESLKKASEGREKKAPGLSPKSLIPTASRTGHLPRKKVPTKIQRSASHASTASKKGSNSSAPLSTPTLRPSPSSAKISIASEAVGPAREAFQRDTGALGRDLPASTRNQRLHHTSAHTTEASSPYTKETKLVFTPPSYKRPLLLERQLLSFISKKKSLLAIRMQPFQVWNSQTTYTSKANTVKKPSLPNNSTHIHRTKTHPPDNIPSLSRQVDSWDLCLTASKYYSQLLNGDGASSRREDLYEDAMTSNERRRRHASLGMRDEGLNVSQ